MGPGARGYLGAFGDRWTATDAPYIETHMKQPKTHPRQSVPDPQDRKERLKAALKANIAKRKAQAAKRGESDSKAGAEEE